MAPATGRRVASFSKGPSPEPVRRGPAAMAFPETMQVAVAAVLGGAAVGHASFPCDADELECTLAGLIAAGRIKGYISHDPPFLVVSKKDPFPRR